MPSMIDENRYCCLRRVARRCVRTAGMSRLEAAAERVGHQLLGQRLRRTFSGRASSACRSATAPSTFVPSKSSSEASIGVRRSPACASAPTRVEVLEREAERIHQLVARRTGRIRAVLLHPLAHDRLRLRLVALGSGGTFGGGAGGGVPSRFSRTHLPRSTGDVRSAYDVTIRMLPLPSRPRRASSVERDAAEMAAVDVRDAVVLREPLVHERVVGGQQVEHAAVFPDDALEEQLGLAAERLPQVVVEVRKLLRVRRLVAQVAQLQPLAREVAHQRVGRGSASMRRTCCSSTAGLARACRARQRQQSLVRDAAPQEERQSRRQLEIADAVHGARRRRRRVALDAEEELGIREDALQRHPDAAVEVAALLPPAVVERDQRLNIRVGDGPAVGAARQRGQDGLRATPLRLPRLTGGR